MKEEQLGVYEIQSGEVVTKVDLKARIIDTKFAGGLSLSADYGEDYYISKISFFKKNYDVDLLTEYPGHVEFSFGCHNIFQIYQMIRENASSIAMLLDPRRDTKWDIIKCAFSLEEKITHLIQERENARKERQQAHPPA